jgi:NAD dependent epimerase/dehydratase family
MEGRPREGSRRVLPQGDLREGSPLHWLAWQVDCFINLSLASAWPAAALSMHAANSETPSTSHVNLRCPCLQPRASIAVQDEVEMWGDGKQTRSFTFIDDCVEGILRITKSDFKEPLNLGSTEMVSMNEMMAMVMGFRNRRLGTKHIPGPEGVRGRNSDNALILEKLGWEPTVTLKAGLKARPPPRRCRTALRSWRAALVRVLRAAHTRLTAACHSAEARPNV